jgi:hypothetical protein
MHAEANCWCSPCLRQYWPKMESEGLAGTMVGCCWIPPSLFTLPSTPMKEEVGRQGEGCNSVAQACLIMLSSPGDEEALGAGGVMSLLSPLTVLQPHPRGGRGQIAW